MIIGQAIKLCDRYRIGPAISGPSSHAEGSRSRVFGLDFAHHAHGPIVEMSELFDEGHANAQAIAFQYVADDFPAQEQCVGQRRRTEYFVHDDDASRRGVREDLMDPHQVVLELASQVFRILFALEVREQLVAQKKLGVPAWYGTTYLRQIVQLAERAGKGRFSAVVGTRYDNQAFFAIEMAIVTDHMRLFDSELVRERQIKRLVAVHRFASRRHTWVAKTQTHRFAV